MNFNRTDSMYASFPMKCTTFVQRLAFSCLLVLFSQISHAADFDALVGVYSFRTPYGDRDIDVVKVEKEGTQYIVYTNVSYTGLQWSSGEVAQPAKLESYAEMLAQAKFGASAAGLETSKAAILQLPACRLAFRPVQDGYRFSMDFLRGRFRGKEARAGKIVHIHARLRPGPMQQAVTAQLIFDSLLR